MKLHVQCDRCKRYAEAPDVEPPYRPRIPNSWHHMRAYKEPTAIDAQYYLPDGPLRVLLCGDCMPIVQKAVEAAIARKT